jgi:hypothetical protein
VLGKLIDLNLAKLADVTNSLALERGKVCCNARVFEVDNSSEGLIEE